jgi:hypothetical protein
MATIDVTGRTLKVSQGKSRSARGPPGYLIPTDQGLAPNETHRGVSPLRISRNRTATPSKCTDLTHVVCGINSLAPDDGLRGKKHVDVHHQVLSEDGKRQLGRIGVKKVTQQPSPQRVDAVSPNRGPTGVERMRLCTAEQQARRRLEKVVTTHKNLEPVINEGLRRGGDVLVELEKKVQKHLLLEASREHLRSKSPDTTSRPRTADLGRSDLSTAPFALETTKAITPSTAQQRLTARKTYHGIVPTTSANVIAPPSRFSKKLDLSRHHAEQAPPYDTAVLSTIYPEPPVVGVAETIPHGKHHVEFNPVRKNIDEELQRKAVARCHFSITQRDTNFLTDQRPATANGADRSTNRSPARAVGTLGASQEARCKATEDRNFTSRRGKMVADDKYRSTALW